MAHIHTKSGQHDHTIGIYIFRTDFDEPKLLLHLHKKVKIYAQFGGHIELHETPWQTLLHELREETGYDMEQLLLLQPVQRLKHVSGAVVHPYPAVHATMSYPSLEGHFHTDTSYVLTTTEEPRHHPDEGESTDIQLFSRAEVLSHSGIDGISRDTALYVFDELLPTWQSISPNEFM